MAVSANLRDRLSGMAPWSGLMAAGTGFALHHQVVSDALHFDCRAAAGGVGIVWGVVALVIVIVGAIVSWHARPEADGPTAAMRRFIVHMSLMAASLAVLGIALLMLAGAILPGCHP